ncbi:MAG: acylneuraminate cytidylyltransferase family protein [Flavobacteriales bacterium]|nr:acylneuraminate cytidylyltransferase family protein [Flavobacteriales bacterium]
MKILAIIPARSGSKGVPDKNIRQLNGKPLLVHSIEAARECTYIKDIMVNTDSDLYANIAKANGAEVPFLRPEHLSGDFATSIDVVVHTLNYYKGLNIHFDAVCLLQPTSPFRRPGFVDEAIKVFIESGADALISVIPVPHEYNPHWVFEPDNEDHLKISTGESKIITRRQDLPAAYIRDGSIYITLTSVLLNEHSFYGNKLTYVLNDAKYHVNIDTESDWLKAEEVANNFPFNDQGT